MSTREYTRSIYIYIYIYIIIMCLRKIVFIYISTTFRPIYPLAFFRNSSKSITFTELRTTSFTESTEVTCSDSISHNPIQVLSIPVLLLACSQVWTCNPQMIVSLEAQGPSITVSLCVLLDNTEWIFGTYKLNVLIWLELLLLCLIFFYLCSYSDCFLHN